MFSLKYVVWCPKYRRNVLTSPIGARLKASLADIADEHGMTIPAVEVMPDHVHMFVEADPTWGVTEIVNRFKGRTSRILRQEFKTLRNRAAGALEPQLLRGDPRRGVRGDGQALHQSAEKGFRCRKNRRLRSCPSNTASNRTGYRWRRLKRCWAISVGLQFGPRPAYQRLSPSQSVGQLQYAGRRTEGGPQRSPRT